MAHKIYWAKRNNGKAILMVKNLLFCKTWISYYFRGRGENINGKYWTKRLNQNK